MEHIAIDLGSKESQIDPTPSRPMAHAWHTRSKKPKPPAGFEPATC